MNVFFRTCLALMVFTGTSVFSQNIAINTTGAVANASAILDIESTSAGLLIPRMTEAQRSAFSPLPAAAQGLIVYQTDAAGLGEGFYYNTSTTTTPNWVKLFGGSSSGGWSLTGNAGTSAASNFIGTTDAVDLVFRTNNATRMSMLANGKVGINMTPTMQLDVTNSSTTTGESAIRGAATGTTGSVYGVQGTTASNSNDAAGVFGNTSGTGRNFGVLGQVLNSTTANSSGVRGYVLSTTGITYGVWGENASGTGNASGVYGIATSATGSTNGVWGHTNSATADAAGVYGSASGNGQVYGIFGSIGSFVTTNAASGVVGKANGATGQVYGVTGISMSSTGIGVIGDAKQTTGANYGVYGISRSTSGTGVMGQCTTITGITTGVWGQVSSTTGAATGVYGEALGASGTTYGVFGYNTSASGFGVFGQTNANGVNYGVYGHSTSTTNGTGWASANDKIAGVYGRAGTGTAQYHAGVFGFQIGTGTRSGGVVGAYSGSQWGALGYTSSGGTVYGVYGAGSSNWWGQGTGRISGDGNAEVLSGIGGGFTGSLLGGWMRGGKYGMVVKGNSFGLFVDGKQYSNNIIAFLSDDGRNIRNISYASAATSVDIYTRGTGKLVNGKAVIHFERNYSSQISDQEKVMITITPTGPSNGVYVTEISVNGFTVIENNNGNSNVEFSWIAVGIRKGYKEPEHPAEVLHPDYDKKMSGVMFNENDTSASATPVWWDGSQLRFDTAPVSKKEDITPEDNKIFKGRQSFFLPFLPNQSLKTN